MLQIEVDPAEVDANVHPAKTEVRFLHERQVFMAVQKAVRAALVAGAESPLWEAANPLDFVSPTARMVNNIYAPLEETPAYRSTAPRTTCANLPMTREPTFLAGRIRGGSLLDDVAAPMPVAKPHYRRHRRKSETVKPPRPSGPLKPRLPLLRVLGQMANTYLVTEGPDGMYLIDQHAAHERVLYERFQARSGRTRPRQPVLLEPLLLDLPPNQRLWLQDPEKKAELAALGFGVEAGDDNSFWLKAIPATLLGRDIKLSLTEILDEAEGVRDGGCHPTTARQPRVPGGGPRSWRDKLAASLACHSAVRAGQILTGEEMRQLITQLERTSPPERLRPRSSHPDAPEPGPARTRLWPEIILLALHIKEEL